MPDHEWVLHTSPDSERDDAPILLRSLETWGPSRALNYMHELDAALDSLLENPFAGAPRNEYLTGCRFWKMQHHHIYYRIRETSVEVLRILHERPDPTGQLERFE